MADRQSRTVPPTSGPDAPERPAKPGSARKLVRQSSLLVAGRILSKLANFLTQILIVRYLSKSDYGGFAYALSVATVLQNVVAFGLDRSITRFLPIYQERGDTPKLFGTIAMAVVVTVSLGLTALAALFSLQGVVGRWVPNQETTLGLLLILAFLAPLQALDDLLVGLFAVFAKARSIFARRFLLAPLLRLAVAVAMIGSGSNVFLLASGYVASTLIGLTIYAWLLFKVMRQDGLLRGWSFGRLDWPWREVLGFTTPLLLTDFTYAAMNTLGVLVLGHYWGTTGVAALTAVQPAARMNELVMNTFGLLYVPLAARMFARKDPQGINGLYWRTAIWIAVFSFPVFALTFSLAEPLTRLLFGDRYVQSAPILALLSLGYYFNAAVGLNGMTLKVFGKVRALVLINLATIVSSVLLSFALIPSLGAIGAGIAVTGTLVIYNLLKQAGLKLGTGVRVFERQYLRAYGGIALCALALLGLELVASPPAPVMLAAAALATWVLLRANSAVLEIGETFPELKRLPGMKFLLRSDRAGGAPARPSPSNLRSHYTRAGWLYVLPRLDLRGLLCIGVPRPGVLRALKRRAGRLGVACVTRGDARARVALQRDPDFAAVEWLDWRSTAPDRETPEWAELAVLVGAGGRAFLKRDGRALHRLASRGGFVYGEGRGAWQRLARAIGVNGAGSSDGAVLPLRLLPFWGEPQAAVPGGDGGILKYLLGKGLAHPWLWSGLSGRARRLLGWVPRRRTLGQRWGVLVGSAGHRSSAPPEYLCRIARDSGVRLEGHRWGLSIPHSYAARKLVFHLFGPSGETSYVAKMVSDARYNERLENEARALADLEALGLADGERIPRVPFAGSHAGLAVLGETLIEGSPFEEASSGQPDCPLAASAVELIVHLGRTSRHASTGPTEAQRLRPHLDRLAELYGDDAMVAFLGSRIEALAQHPGPLPLVFRHGDPGAHNLLATRRGVALLDWETADRSGLPLWDLLHFLRSYGVLCARRTGLRAPARGFEMMFLADSGLSRWGRDVIARYCERVGVAESLIEPLFYTCWMHRAVQEADRIGDRRRSPSMGVLRRSMREDARGSRSAVFATVQP